MVEEHVNAKKERNLSEREIGVFWISNVIIQLSTGGKKLTVITLVFVVVPVAQFGAVKLITYILYLVRLNEMKKLVFILLFLLAGCVVTSQPFIGTTKHKPIKRMTRVEWQKAETGHSLYIRDNGKVVRNSGREWTVFKKPKYKSGNQPCYKKRTPIFKEKRK